MTGSRHDLPRERAIHRALASDGAQQDALEPEPSRVQTSLLLCLYLTQTVIAGIFCAICYWVYGGALPASLAHSWPALLAILAMAWTGALPLLAWLWRFAPSVETRLTLWGSYWIGLIALPVALLVIAVGVVRRGKREVVAPRSELSLLAGVITTWPIMQVAAYLACEEALPVSLAEDALSPYWSFVLAYGACLALPLALTAMALHVRRRRLVQAANAREIAGTGALVPGEAMVTGVVELAEGESCAVELRIDQEGTEQESSGTWSHTWTETGRRLTVRPFYLKTKAGDRVRVLAGDHVKLMDALDRKILVNRTARTCIAELTPGEAVSAFGQLFRGRDPEAVPQAGYRSSAVGWVLRAPEGGKMLLSSYPIYRPFDERARRILWWVAALLVVVVAGHVALLGYHLRVAWGERIPATVTDARIVK